MALEESNRDEVLWLVIVVGGARLLADFSMA
jgi:hypothetical protein